MRFSTKKVTITSFDEKNGNKGEKLRMTLSYKKPFDIDENTEEGRDKIISDAEKVVAKNSIQIPCIVTFGNTQNSHTVLLTDKKWA